MRDYKKPLFERNNPETAAEKQKKRDSLKVISSYLLFDKYMDKNETRDFVNAIYQYFCAEYGLDESETDLIFNGDTRSTYAKFSLDEEIAASKTRNLQDGTVPKRHTEINIGYKALTNTTPAKLMLVTLHELRHVLQYNLLFEDMVLDKTDEKRFKNVDPDYLTQLKSNLLSNESEDKKLPYFGNQMYYIQKLQQRIKEKITRGKTDEADKFFNWCKQEQEVDAESFAHSQTSDFLKYAIQQSDGSFLNSSKLANSRLMRFQSANTLSVMPASLKKQFRHREQYNMQIEEQDE